MLGTTLFHQQSSPAEKKAVSFILAQQLFWTSKQKKRQKKLTDWPRKFGSQTYKQNTHKNLDRGVHLQNGEKIMSIQFKEVFQRTSKQNRLPLVYTRQCSTIWSTYCEVKQQKNYIFTQHISMFYSMVKTSSNKTARKLNTVHLTLSKSWIRL